MAFDERGRKDNVPETEVDGSSVLYAVGEEVLYKVAEDGICPMCASGGGRQVMSEGRNRVKMIQNGHRAGKKGIRACAPRGVGTQEPFQDRN
jgi:hypothetical protein